MKKYSKDVDEFLTKFVLPVMKLSEYNEDNISDIVEYMFREIEGPLCDAEEAGDILSNQNKTLLEAVSKAIAEITTRDDWY
ncbi:MAG TPA: hypothetical protein VJY64_01700 [Candidatus Onthovivens sp.]|nr:hypothetical protein [Candidatus Onthovivens sp.]